MKMSYYVIITLGYYALVVTGGILIEDLGVIFEILAGLTIS